METTRRGLFKLAAAAVVGTVLPWPEWQLQPAPVAAGTERMWQSLAEAVSECKPGAALLIIPGGIRELDGCSEVRSSDWWPRPAGPQVHFSQQFDPAHWDED